MAPRGCKIHQHGRICPHVADDSGTKGNKCYGTGG